jgi:hypothetical protein
MTYREEILNVRNRHFLLEEIVLVEEKDLRKIDLVSTVVGKVWSSRTARVCADKEKRSGADSLKKVRDQIVESTYNGCLLKPLGMTY